MGPKATNTNKIENEIEPSPYYMSDPFKKRNGLNIKKPHELIIDFKIAS